MYQVIMNGTRLGSYQVFTNLGLTSGSDGKPVFFKCLLAGALSGALGALFGSPAYMVSYWVLELNPS
jgi:solute carrier family 25 protein 34/35